MSTIYREENPGWGTCTIKCKRHQLQDPSLVDQQRKRWVLCCVHRDRWKAKNSSRPFPWTLMGITHLWPEIILRRYAKAWWSGTACQTNFNSLIFPSESILTSGRLQHHQNPYTCFRKMSWCIPVRISNFNGLYYRTSGWELLVYNRTKWDISELCKYFLVFALQNCTG